MLLRMLLFPLVLITGPALAQSASSAVVDPAPNRDHPPGMSAFVIPANDGAMNAMMYVAAGAGPHPTLLLLHGFPGNEQNLDLAQAARRAGWDVLTLHYRGSWGSPGKFSFAHAAEDAHTALAWLRAPVTIAKYAIDSSRIAVAGHSMGGFMAADAAADDPQIIGLFLIDGWPMSKYGSATATPAGLADWRARHRDDAAPLNEATIDGLAAEIRANPARFDLRARILAYGNRPLAIYGAMQARGSDNLAILDAAVAAGNRHATGGFWPTDHGFSDSRIALSIALVDWLNSLPRK